jgi:hypothetical protein
MPQQAAAASGSAVGPWKPRTPECETQTSAHCRCLSSPSASAALGVGSGSPCTRDVAAQGMAVSRASLRHALRRTPGKAQRQAELVSPHGAPRPAQDRHAHVCMLAASVLSWPPACDVRGDAPLQAHALAVSPAQRGARVCVSQISLAEPPSRASQCSVYFEGARSPPAIRQSASGLASMPLACSAPADAAACHAKPRARHPTRMPPATRRVRANRRWIMHRQRRQRRAEAPSMLVRGPAVAALTGGPRSVRLPVPCQAQERHGAVGSPARRLGRPIGAASARQGRAPPLSLLLCWRLAAVFSGSPRADQRPLAAARQAACAADGTIGARGPVLACDAASSAGNAETGRWASAARQCAERGV